MYQALVAKVAFYPTDDPFFSGLMPNSIRRTRTGVQVEHVQVEHVQLEVGRTNVQIESCQAQCSQLHTKMWSEQAFR